MKRDLTLSVTMALLAGWLQSAAAEVVYVNVDFQPGGSGGGTSETFSAQGAVATPGSTWNAVAPSTDGANNGAFGSGGQFDFSGDPYVVTGLLDSEGAATGVGLEIFKGDPDGGFALNPNNGFDANIADDAKELMRDYLISGWASESNAVNIIGLPPGVHYTLVLYGAGDNDAVSSEFNIDGVITNTTGVPNGSHDLTAGQDYVVYSGITASGTITIWIRDNLESADGHFNGFQLYYNLNSIPTVTEWGLILLVASVMMAGLSRLTRKAKVV
ncbi:MAG: hypothetical protein KJ626_16450 [Verrucomicrobia bacterium]|nr:hypothetical protein [Verrucomicrobiota bacterium]